MSAPSIVVAGLGRCGMSCVMQMLHAVGIPCAGDWPDFEPEEMNLGRSDFRDFGGQAIKVLDPQNRPGLQFAPQSQVILMTRSATIQAQSHMRFLQQSFAVDVHSVVTQDKLARSLERDIGLATRECMRSVGVRNVKCLWFEDMIREPLGFAGALVKFLGLPKGWEDTMSKVVIKRTPGLNPTFLEFEQLASLANFPPPAHIPFSRKGLG